MHKYAGCVLTSLSLVCRHGTVWLPWVFPAWTLAAG